MATSEIYITKGVDAREPFASTDPVHQRMGKSIFHLRVDCEKCGIGGYGTCFLLQDLSKDCDGDYVYFATAAHNLYCVSFPEKEKNPNCETGCNQYRFVKIIERWNLNETEVYLTDNIGKNSKAGWLKVSNKYEKSAKSVQVQVKVRKADAATHQAKLDRFTYDFGVIAARKVDLLDNNPSLLPGPDQQVPVFRGKEEPDEVSAYLCGYPGRVGNHSDGEDPPLAEKRKYWVPSANRVVVLAPNMLKHYVHSSGGQSGAPLYKLTPSGTGEAPCVLGIHVGGDPKSNPRDRHNLAVKLRTDSPTLRTIRGWVLSDAQYDRDDTVEPVPFEGATSEMIEEPNVFTLPVSMEGDKKPSHSVVHKPQTLTSAPRVQSRRPGEDLDPRTVYLDRHSIPAASASRINYVQAGTGVDENIEALRDTTQYIYNQGLLTLPSSDGNEESDIEEASSETLAETDVTVYVDEEFEKSMKQDSDDDGVQEIIRTTLEDIGFMEEHIIFDKFRPSKRRTYSVAKKKILIRIVLDIAIMKVEDREFIRNTIINRLKRLTQSRGRVVVAFSRDYNSIEVFLLVPGRCAIALHYTAIVFPGILAGLGVLEWNLVGSLDFFDLRVRPEVPSLDNTGIQPVRRLFSELFLKGLTDTELPNLDLAQPLLKSLVEKHEHDNEFIDFLGKFILNDSQASLLQKSQFLLDSPKMSEGDLGLSGHAASSDTEGQAKAENPFLTTTFTAELLPLMYDMPQERLCAGCGAAELLDSNDLDTLSRILRNDGSCAHADKLVSFLVAGGHETFAVLCDVIVGMNISTASNTLWAKMKDEL